MSCFLPPELWILSSLTETCLHFRPGSVINLKPSSYFDVSLSLLGVNVDGVCRILPLLCWARPVNLRNGRIFWYHSNWVLPHDGEGIIDYGVRSLWSVCFPVWYLWVMKTCTEVIRTLGIPWHSQRRYHSSRLKVASSALVIRLAFGNRQSSLTCLRHKFQNQFFTAFYISNSGTDQMKKNYNHSINKNHYYYLMINHIRLFIL